MEIHQLKYFVAVAKELSFHKAAKAVGVTQPTLSQQIQKLEKDLGTKLFERSPQFVHMTLEGKRFLPYALQVLDVLKHAENEIQFKQQKLEGQLRVAFIPTIGPYVLPQLLKILKRKAPNLKLELFELTTSMLLEGLKHSHFDLGVLALPIEDSAIKNQKVGEESFFIACSKNHALAKKKEISIKDLKSQDLLILQEGHCFRDQALEFCTRYNKNVKIQFEGSSMSSVTNLAASNFGVTIVPEMVTTYSQKDLVFKPFSKPKPYREIGLVWRNSYQLNYSEIFFLKVLESLFV